jgi:hypothetical protein
MKFTKTMQEISGFGGSYEEACRKMIIKGAQWLAKHPKADLKVGTYKNIYGVTTTQSPDAEELEKVFTSVSKDLTGAMVQAAWSHLLFIQKNGWKKYVESMSKKK